MTTDPTTTDHDNKTTAATALAELRNQILNDNEVWDRDAYGIPVNRILGMIADRLAAARTPTQPTGRDHDHAREEAGAELNLALGMLQQIRDMSDPTSPALVESMVHAMVDGSCDLSDRDPGREVWDQAREDITLVLPIVREAIAGAVAAERERIAKARQYEDFDSFVEAELSDTLLVRDGHGTIWTAFETDSGHWWAVRPRHEDDEKGPDGDEWRPVGLVDVEVLPFPLTAVVAHEALARIARSAS